jgi:hypothetical protein
MASRVRKLFRASAVRALVVLAILAGLAGGGWSIANSSPSAPANADVDPLSRAASGACAATALDALGSVAMRVYREGVASERTSTALHLIATSIPLREATERGDAAAARAAAEALLATGHMTNLEVLRGAQTLAAVGGPNALAPLRGTILGAGGAPIGTFVASVWADNGFVAETDGIAEGETALRAGRSSIGGHSIAGSFALPPGELPARGTLTEKGVDYQYTSFPVALYPSGAALVYLLRSVRSTASLCGATEQDTVANTLSHVARLIYAGEAGRRTLTQVHRVEHDQALLDAVARRDPTATRAAIVTLLNQHIVRLRVSAGGRLLSDVGGPFVLAPVHAALRLGGRTIGSFVLSIQDDEGYLRLARRLAGLDVLMYMGARLVKNSLGPAPGKVPTGGPYRYRGHTFRAFTFHAEAFPSGPLRIAVLIPIPYA